jgi:hypothetical protein
MMIFQSMIPKSMPSDLIRWWEPVFGKDHAQARWRCGGAGSTADRNDLRDDSNTSSIMVRNDPSIMQREAGRVTAS